MNNTHFCENVQIGDQIILSALTRDADPRIVKATVIAIEPPPTWGYKMERAVKIKFLTRVNGIEIQLGAIIHRAPKPFEYIAIIAQKGSQEGTQCPGCGESITHAQMDQPYNNVRGTYTCPRCNGVLGRIHISQLSQIANLGEWHNPEVDGPENTEDWRYFDLELDSKYGRERYHGWFHNGSKKLLQTG